MKALTRRPWLLVILAFVVLIGAWITLFIVAGKNTPEFIPVAKAGEVSAPLAK